MIDGCPDVDVVASVGVEVDVKVDVEVVIEVVVEVDVEVVVEVVVDVDNDHTDNTELDVADLDPLQVHYPTALDYFVFISFTYIFSTVVQVGWL